MSRPIRYIPAPQTLVEVTTRTVQSRFLLRPNPELNEIIAGILARAQHLYGMSICAFVCLSNHYHLLLRVDTAKQLAEFMAYLNSNLAREVGRRVGWKDKFWSRRFRAIVISEEEGAQMGRLKYLLAHGVKEGLVARLREWPGIHAIRALLDGEPIEGYWFDRTEEYYARRRGEDFDRLVFATRETVVFSPLPCWEHLSPEAQRERIAQVVLEIEGEAQEDRKKTGKTPLGAAAIRRQNPHDCPPKPKKSPAPLFHAVSRQAHKTFRDAYRRFLAAFREAAQRLKEGDRTALFPVGCFPPALPFVSS